MFVESLALAAFDIDYSDENISSIEKVLFIKNYLF